jgi:hypothetical protein
MIREMEALTAEAVASEAGSTAHPAQTHANCLNCGARLHGRFCHDCGQSADDHHRSIGHLLWEAVEGFTHLDGRLARTLPALLLHPGRLARDHIEGRRQRHVPPFRLFLITLLVFMFTAELAFSGAGARETTDTRSATTGRHTYQVGNQRVVVASSLSTASAELQKEKPEDPVGRWMVEHIGRATQNREYYMMLVFEWAHRLAVLMLPILAALLTLCYVYKKEFYVYDHLVVAMQYLSFCFLVWAPVWVSPKWLADWLFPAALVWTPLNLYLILRTAYGSRRLGAAVKAVALWACTVAVFGALLAGLTLYALNKM